jgi:hypothetical protein
MYNFILFTYFNNSMAELVAFRASLGRIGFTVAGQDALVAQGFTSMTRLLMFQTDQIKRICKLLRERDRDPIDINITQEQLLEAMRSWVKTRTRCGMYAHNALPFYIGSGRGRSHKDGKCPRSSKD